MFDVLGAVLSFIRRQIGLRTDAADVAGSLHAKVKQLNDTTVPNQVATRQAPRGPVNAGGGYCFTAAETLRTVLNITGKGRLIGASVYAKATGDAFKLTVDGQIFKTATMGTADAFNYPPHNFLGGGVNITFAGDNINFTTSGSWRNLEIEFKTSLKIEVTGSIDTVVRWLYSTE